MIVQPEPLGPPPRSRPRRMGRAVVLVLPVLLLVTVVGIGLTGPSPVPAPSPRAAQASTPAEAIAAATPGPDAPGAAPVFPSEIAGLAVHGVEWTLEARSRGLARGVIAVAGYFALDSLPGECTGGRLGVLGPFCARTGILGERPWFGVAETETDVQPYHLHPQVPVGVRAPYQASAGADSPAVVLLARFDDPRAQPCLPEGRHCGQELVVERVAWVDGTQYPNMASIDPFLDGPRSANGLRRAATTVEALLPDGAVPLLSAYVLPRTLARIHPDAAAGLPTDRGVWYVRGLDREGDPDLIDWLVVDPDSNAVLRSGSIITSRFAMGRGGG